MMHIFIIRFKVCFECQLRVRFKVIFQMQFKVSQSHNIIVLGLSFESC